jgi:hypothetical protein
MQASFFRISNCTAMSHGDQQTSDIFARSLQLASMFDHVAAGWKFCRRGDVKISNRRRNLDS